MGSFAIAALPRSGYPIALLPLNRIQLTQLASTRNPIGLCRSAFSHSPQNSRIAEEEAPTIKMVIPIILSVSHKSLPPSAIAVRFIPPTFAHRSDTRTVRFWLTCTLDSCNKSGLQDSGPSQPAAKPLMANFSSCSLAILLDVSVCMSWTVGAMRRNVDG